MVRNWKTWPAVLLSTLLTLTSPPSRACTIVVLTDAKHALFCNNEDWTDPNTRIWFQTAGKGYYGAVYVGFDNGWAQGGLNTEGLAYDWVMVFPTPQTWDSNLPGTRGQSCQRMLETCATVKEAIAFYRTWAEPGFSTSVIMLADKSGASVIMGIRNGKLVVEESDQSRGFGFGGRGKLTSALAHRAALDNPPEPTVAEGFELLSMSRQAGKFATKYSNVFDLKSGDIFLRSTQEQTVEVQFNLADQLKKGDHHYDMPAILTQLKQAPRPLPTYLKRFPLDEYKPIPDSEPQVTARIAAMVAHQARGRLRPEDFTADFWEREILPNVARAHVDLKRLGEMSSITLVEHDESSGQRSYRHRLEFVNGTVILHVVFDPRNKVKLSAAEAIEWKTAAVAPKPPRQ